MATRLTHHTKLNVRDLVDALGQLKAQKAAIADQEDRLVTRLKDLGVDEYHGKLFDAVVFEQNRATVDWPAIVKRYKIPARVVTKYTTVTPSLTCKVTARK